MLRKYLSWSVDSWAAVILVLLYGLLLLSLQNPTSMDDGLRHFAMAKLLAAQGVWNVPGWSAFLYEGYFHATPVDPWFLSDVILIPFTAFPIAKGLQLFIVAELACLCASFLLVLRSLKLPAFDRMMFLCVLLFGDTQFMGRFLLGRPYALMTAMMLFVLWSILERKWIMLTFLLAISVLLSQLFVFPLIICLCAILSFCIVHQRKNAASIFVASFAGVLIGLLLHPHPLSYVQYLITAFLRIPFLGSIGLSREMQMGISDVAMISVLIGLGVATLLIARLFAGRTLPQLRKNPDFLCVTMIVGIFLIAFILWVRAIDVLWPILIVWVASLYALDRRAFHELWHALLPIKSVLLNILLYGSLLIVIGEVLAVPIILIRDNPQHSLSQYETMHIIPAHARVLNLDWQMFFSYVAVRPDLQYAAGIDRSFTYLTDSSVSDDIRSLENISKEHSVASDIQEKMDHILQSYHSDYLVVSHAVFQPVIDMLKQDASWQMISDSPIIAIFKIHT